MRELAAGEQGTDLASDLRLELEFELQLGKELPGGPEFTPPVSLADCVRLFAKVDQWLAITETLSRASREEPWASDESLLQLTNRALPRESGFPIRNLSLRSPFFLNIALTGLTVPGLGLLLYGAKKLYGIDLELKTHRERLRAEYLEAVEWRERLEKEDWPGIDHALDAKSSVEMETPPFASEWSMTRGELDEEE